MGNKQNRSNGTHASLPNELIILVPIFFHLFVLLSRRCRDLLVIKKNIITQPGPPFCSSYLYTKANICIYVPQVCLPMHPKTLLVAQRVHPPKLWFLIFSLFQGSFSSFLRLICYLKHISTRAHNLIGQIIKYQSVLPVCYIYTLFPFLTISLGTVPIIYLVPGIENKDIWFV